MSMTRRPTVLFVCPDNAGLSLMAEALVLHAYKDLRPFSAATAAPGAIDPALVECLEAARIPADGLSPKPAGVFSLSGAPRLDLVVALGDEAGRALRRQAWVGVLRLETWLLPEVPRGDDHPQRRASFRRILPQLASAIGHLEERFTLRGAGAAA